jgi:hypothetical protein
MVNRRTLIYIFLVALCAPSLAGARVSSPAPFLGNSQAQEAPTVPKWIAPRGGKPFFVIGANYEGANDRAWLMWEDDQFDIDVIDGDFAKASSVGVNTLRIFVQKPLRDDILAGDFSKLDAVLGLARRYNLWIILTFTDWPEPDLQRAADLNRRIAAHLASEPSILAYDTKNEPQFTDVAGAIFPSSVAPVPLQSPDTISTYGERIPRASIGEYRRGEGKNVIPARMTDDQAYLMANYYKLYLEFLDASSAWVSSHAGTTTIDYMSSADSASWGPLLNAMDATLMAWNNVQMDPVRAADPGRLITTGYSNMILARMPSNAALSFHSLHRFTSHGAGGVNVTFRVLDGLQRAFPTQPVMLEEFGYPGQASSSGGGVTGFDPRTTANLESAVWAYLYSKGFAGGAKWMLNNFTQGYDPAQNSYGLFDNSDQPKLTAYALRQLSDTVLRLSPGTMLPTVRSDDNFAASYAYTARGVLVAGGKVYTSTNLIYTSAAPSQVVMTNMSGTLTLFSTDVSTVTLNLPGMFGVPVDELSKVTLMGLDPQGQPWTPPVPALNGDWLKINLKPLYKYRLFVMPRAVERAEARIDPDSVYFPQVGHNLSDDFLRYWQTYGGIPIFGYPLTEAFHENGYLVQYFERNRFEYHPENTPPYDVLLGRLGADYTVGKVYPGVQPFTSEPSHRYFPETGHSLNYAFLGYWERNGGLALFGYPLSEEIREVSPTDGREYTVQYFERARFEYHPEYQGTDAEVLLGLLGVSTLQGKGWLP